MSEKNRHETCTDLDTGDPVCTMTDSTERESLHVMTEDASIRSKNPKRNLWNPS